MVWAIYRQNDWQMEEGKMECDCSGGAVNSFVANNGANENAYHKKCSFLYFQMDI